MEIHILDSPSKEEVDLEGRLLFESFVREQLANEGVADLTVFAEDSSDADEEFSLQSTSSSSSSIPDGYFKSKWSKAGKNLKKYAAEFRNSPQRMKVKEEADKIDLNDLDSNTCRRFLNDYFKDGVDLSSLLALFFFCSDVLLRYVKDRKIELAKRFFMWCMEFILNKVCKCVYEHGGWENVLCKIWSRTKLVAFIVLTTLGVAAIAYGIVYIKKH